jgi:DNA (cytosine-5)-methyltransferase 1
VGDGWSIAWRILDAQFWGVPQRRRRIFLVADFGGQSAPEVLFKREGLSRHLKESREAREGITSDVEGSTDKAVTMLMREGCRGGGKGPLIQNDKSATLACNNSQTLFAPKLYESHPNDSRVTGPCEKSPTISSRFGTGGNNTPLVQNVGGCLTPWDVQSKRIHDVNGKWPTLYSHEGGGGAHGYAAITCASKQYSQNIGFDVAAPLMAEDYKEPQIVCAGFCPEQSAKTRGIGYEEEISPTIRNGVTPGVVAFTQNQREEVRILGDKAGALAAEPGVHQQTYCLQGSMIGREDKNGPQGDGINKDVSFTLNTTDRHAVAHKIDCSPEGISGTVSSKWAKGTGRPAGDEHYNLIAEPVYGADLSQKAEGICFEKEIAPCLTVGTHAGHGSHVISGIDCRNGKENGDISGTIQKNGNSLNAMHPVRVGYSVRRLTPLECERLQDYPDFWTGIEGSSDSGRYKACGNSVAVVCPEYVLEGIKEVIERGQIS